MKNEKPASTARGPGRPRVHPNAAARQKAYRARLKAAGFREIKKIVRDVRGDRPLTSSIIDLSEINQRRRFQP